MNTMEDYFAERAPQGSDRDHEMTVIELHRCLNFFNDISKSWQVLCSTPNDFGADFFYSVTLFYSAENGSGIKVEKYGEGVNGLKLAIDAVLDELSGMGVDIPQELTDG